MPGVARGVQTVNRPVIWDISVSTTISEIVDYRGYIPTHLRLPAAFTGVAITFQARNSAGDFVSLRDNAGAAVSITVAQDQVIDLDSEVLAGLGEIKLVSGTAEAADRVASIACML